MKRYNINKKYIKSGFIVKDDIDHIYRFSFKIGPEYSSGPAVSVICCWFPLEILYTWTEGQATNVDRVVNSILKIHMQNLNNQ